MQQIPFSAWALGYPGPRWTLDPDVATLHPSNGLGREHPPLPCHAAISTPTAPCLFCTPYFVNQVKKNRKTCGKVCSDVVTP